MKNKISVAIDGPSGAGKSTIAKQIAAKYSFMYVDTGAIYRTVGLACRRNGVDCKNAAEVTALLPDISIDIEYDESGLQHMFLNGEDVSKEIRMPEISICASDVSALSVCRDYLLELQRSFAEQYCVVMDGRDIGTVVLPKADLKIFLTASIEERARRRLLELEAKGIESTFEEVLNDMQYRDYQDTHRDIAPLKKAADAIEIDTSDLDFEQSIAAVCTYIDALID